MKRMTMIKIFTVLLVMVFSSVALAAGDGNQRKGKHLYRKVYKECHGEDARPVSPDSKTQAQWVRFFKKKDFTDFGCKEKWDALSEDDLNDIMSYLHAHAFDSPSPAKCK